MGKFHAQNLTEVAAFLKHPVECKKNLYVVGWEFIALPPDHLAAVPLPLHKKSTPLSDFQTSLTLFGPFTNLRAAANVLIGQTLRNSK